jgi:PadR family transcriptional regulator, regulatory protein PadR
VGTARSISAARYVIETASALPSLPRRIGTAAIRWPLAPGHGYEPSQRLTQRSGGELGVHEGSLYPALHRLERGGLVESSWSTGDGRRRRIYRLTSAGRRAARRSRQEWQAFSTAVDRVLGSTA